MLKVVKARLYFRDVDGIGVWAALQVLWFIQMGMGNTKPTMLEGGGCEFCVNSS